MRRTIFKKNVTSALLCLVLIILSAGCGSGGQGAKTGSQTAGVEDVLEAGMAEADTSGSQDTQAGENAAEDSQNPDSQAANESSGKEAADSAGTDQAAAGDIDVDLTALSSTMVYSEVYNMMVTPENYMGKTVKMTGTFSRYHDDSANIDYYTCVIKDATACCAQGIEFRLKDKYTYPDDYPKEGGDISVVGVFDTYQEGENTYCQLIDADLARL